MEHVAARIVVNGIVQGVGFRPFVFNLANRHGLTGEVANTSSGVVILVEGSADHINAFATDLTGQATPFGAYCRRFPAVGCGDRLFGIHDHPEQG